jgi:hypothetical protein
MRVKLDGAFEIGDCRFAVFRRDGTENKSSEIVAPTQKFFVGFVFSVTRFPRTSCSLSESSSRKPSKILCAMVSCSARISSPCASMRSLHKISSLATSSNVPSHEAVRPLAENLPTTRHYFQTLCLLGSGQRPRPDIWQSPNSDARLTNEAAQVL